MICGQFVIYVTHESVTLGPDGMRGPLAHAAREAAAIGSYPLQVIAASHSPGANRPAQRDFLVLSLELTIDGTPWLGAAPAIVGGEL
jgi:hypothetical protein